MNDDELDLGYNTRATYDPDTDEVDTVTLVQNGSTIELTPSQAMRLGQWASDRQSRYS